MTGYAVNIAELAKLIQTLEDGAHEVREANTTLAAEGQLDMLGHDALRDSAHEFEETWRYELGKLDEAAEGVIERLAAAKKNYEELEDAHGGLFDQVLTSTGGDGGLSGGSPPLITDANRPPGMAVVGGGPMPAARDIGAALDGASPNEGCSVT
ncbi:hypothetical protein [Haloechinothrix salitolerans]|uniref:Excreted virulence factor EspC, type VII ESX diderm n=1 Tax=Haloechinothrix salitolerans TaxID=926830 RepID=A0ABW2BVI1_9PSEU